MSARPDSGVPRWVDLLIVLLAAPIAWLARVHEIWWVFVACGGTIVTLFGFVIAFAHWFLGERPAHTGAGMDRRTRIWFLASLAFALGLIFGAVLVARAGRT